MLQSSFNYLILQPFMKSSGYTNATFNDHIIICIYIYTTNKYMHRGCIIATRCITLR